MVFLFYIAVFIIVYTYSIYPFLLSFFPSAKNKENNFTATVTVIIPAFNEKEIIEEKILNTIAVCKNLSAQIILVSNGSDDGTEAFRHPEITHLHSPIRKGKPEAINTALPVATGSIIVFTDANTLLSEGALEKLLSHFSQENIGAVCGEKAFSTKHMEVVVENIYWKFESRLKEKEATCYSVVGAAGELFAVRKELLTDIPENMLLDDFFISMQVCKKGRKIGYEKEAKAIEKPSLHLMDEYHRRVRIASGVMQWLLHYGIVDFWKYNVILKWQFFSHRFCRWILSPLALIAICITGFYLAETHPIYPVLILIYFLVAFIGFLLHCFHIYINVFYYPFYFLFVHICLLTGYTKYLFNKHTILWQKAKRN